MKKNLKKIDLKMKNEENKENKEKEEKYIEEINLLKKK